MNNRHSAATSSANCLLLFSLRFRVAVELRKMLGAENAGYLTIQRAASTPSY
jgi:hypothetical protein